MNYLFTAYTIIWLAIFGYVVSLSRRQTKLDQEIETVKKILDSKS